MGVLVIGDVHACYYTLKKLVQEHWQPEEDLLVFVGDLLNKGAHSVKTWRYWLKLSAKYPNKVILIRGNHEQWFLKHFRKNKPSKQFIDLVAGFNRKGLTANDVAAQIAGLPLHWENEDIYVSHAGFSAASQDPFNINRAHNLLENRKKLKALAKVQVCGHQILESDKPLFKTQENAWLIDTGAWTGRFLSALLFTDNPHKPKVIRVPRDARDEATPIGD